MASKQYEFRVPILGFVLVDEGEKAVIDTPPFQRLRSIRQLGMTFLVYPGACHTRFEHSLGTMELATRIFDLLRLKYKDELQSALGWKNDSDFQHARRLLRLAALLHDVGHAPFSHSSEALLPRGKPHEHYTREIIENSLIAKVLRKSGLEDEEIANVADIATEKALTPDQIFLSQLITGEVGADRIDYLLRDCHHTGVEYGRFDHQRIIHTLEFAPLPGGAEEQAQPGLAIEEGGLHAVEGMMLARYFMFLQVYYHKTRRVLERHLGIFLKDYLGGTGFNGLADVDDYLQWDDNRVLHLLRQKKFRRHRSRILGRQHYQLVERIGPHPNKGEVVKFMWLKRELEARFEDQIIFDMVEPTRVCGTGVQVHLLTGEHAGKVLPLISLSSNEEPASRLSDILCRHVRYLSVYASRGSYQEIKNFCDKFWGDRKKEGV